jgi:uncharacterized OB-fold protein
MERCDNCGRAVPPSAGVCPHCYNDLGGYSNARLR